MIDRELRNKLDEIGIIRVNFLEKKLEDVNINEYLELKAKVDLILDYLGLEFTVKARLEKTIRQKKEKYVLSKNKEI